MSFNYDSYIPMVTRRESGGNPNARNPNSSASGLFQFIDPTYMAYARRMYPQVSESALMARKNDPETQNQIMRAFTMDNVGVLEKAGIKPTNGSVYAAHFLGPQGAARALTAPETTPIHEVINQNAIKANAGVFRGMKTVADFRRWAEGYQGQQGGSGEALPLPSGQHTSEEVAAADLPAPDAAQAQLQAQPERSMWDRFAGGDGDFSFADGMVGAGAALMARDNPSGAAALASALRYSKDGKTKKGVNRSVVKTDPKTGQVTVYDPETNTFKTQQVFDREPEMPGKPTAEMFQKNREAADTAYGVAEKMARHREKLVNGEIDLDILSQATNGLDSLSGKQLNQKQLNAVEFARDIMQMRDAKLLEAKGVQTEGDAQRALDSIVPGLAKYNSSATLTAIDRGIADLTKSYDRHTTYNDALWRKYGSRIAEETYADTIGQRKKWITDTETAFAPKRETYSKRAAEQQQQTQQAVTGRPVTTNSNGGSETPKFREGQKAKLPDGRVVTFRNGQWE